MVEARQVGWCGPALAVDRVALFVREALEASAALDLPSTHVCYYCGGSRCVGEHSGPFGICPTCRSCNNAGIAALMRIEITI